MQYDSLYIQDILSNPRVAELRNAIVQHDVFNNINSQKNIRMYMEHHVFQVWDFMILLKSIQFGVNSVYKKGSNNFSCWYPKVPGKFSRLITEIVLDEESDSEINDLSHFEYYLKAMEQSEADLYYIERAMWHVRMSDDISLDLHQPNFFPSESVKEHFLYMREISNIVEDPDKLIFQPLASFFFCREDLIPDFFTSIVTQTSERWKTNNAFFINYLQRHIDLDGGEHSEKWYELLAYFLSDENFEKALEIIIRSFELRLWVLNTINEKILATK